MNISCHLCGKSSFITLEDDETPYRVLKCHSCSLVFVHPQPNYTELKGHYDDGYYKDWLDRQKKQRLRMWNRRVKKIISAKKPGRLMDVGCGEGTFLALIQQEGWKICGTEFSEFAARHASDLLGTDIFCGELPSAGFQKNTFDVVTMWHVLEHVDDPKKYLKEAYRILKPDGLFVLAVPNVNNLVFQFAYRVVKGRKLKLFTKGEKEIHLFHFSPTTLKRFLEEAGFRRIKLRPDFGIVEPAKKIVNLISVIPHYLGGINTFDAIEVFATPDK
ncbi:MAG: class I SAM-dependent methyltransferase [Thermodesulfobacteriota bacterium]